MKGIILAGGKGSRLDPITRVVCKQLLPIYDKPMIYYPLSILLQCGIREILIISTPGDRPLFERLLGTGAHLGVQFHYAIQEEPKGIAQAFHIAEAFIGNDSVSLILGDNIFYGHHFQSFMKPAQARHVGGMIFGYEVNDPGRYGVLQFNEQNEVVDIIEKPLHPPSRYAVTGLYFYNSEVVEIAKHLIPSARGELEITDVNKAYLQRGRLQCHLFDRGFAWLDTGTPDAMQEASQFVQTIQHRQGIKIGCIEEIAYQMGFIDENQLLLLAHAHPSSDYGLYLTRVVMAPSIVS